MSCGGCETVELDDDESGPSPPLLKPSVDSLDDELGPEAGCSDAAPSLLDVGSNPGDAGLSLLPRSSVLSFDAVAVLADPSLDAVDAALAAEADDDDAALTRCSAAFTDAGDSDAGREFVTVVDTEWTPCRPSTSARRVARVHPPTRSPLRRTPPA